jgi:cytochrome c-type biogenesis protein CcmF
MTEAAIDTGLFRDLYVSLGEPLGSTGGWSVRVYSKPFVDWIWGGCFLMGIGGFLAISDKRYRIASRQKKKQVVSPKEANDELAPQTAVVSQNAAQEGKV